MKKYGVEPFVKAVIFMMVFIFVVGKSSYGLPINADCTWKAGVSKTKITPEGELCMAGFAFRNRPSNEVRHDLWVKALAIQSCDGQLGVLVSLDVVGLPRYILQKVYTRVSREYNISKEQLMINSSHTHSGPFLYDPFRPQYNEALVGTLLEDVIDYADTLANQITTTIGRAMESMEPARLYSGEGMVNFQVNRRNNSESQLKSLTELKGPNDYSVPVIKVENLQGEIKTILFSYACHATVIGDYQWSGDYPGVAQIELEKLYPGSVAMFFQGCGADQNPLPRGTPALLEQYGRMLAIAVDCTLHDNMRELDSSLYFNYQEIDLKLQPPPDKAELLEELQNGPQHKKFWASHLLKQLESEGKLIDKYSYPVQYWKLGDQTMVGLAGEVVIDYAISVKRMLGQDVFVFGYCSEGNLSYIPSARIIEEGGYEGKTAQFYKGFPSPWSPEIEVQILRTVQDMYQRHLEYSMK
ncbi:MAG TPA: neutral/alkaline non-lysosomal ceramidase N-terminal domain-containing protein [Membranihabitans sp.]|nr:neutral/alkaline non-lysosomal ceramidase N-terminal domain-containing protein [Membranihabitans sp.]